MVGVDLSSEVRAFAPTKLQRRTAATIRRRFRHMRRRTASTMVERSSRKNSHHMKRMIPAGARAETAPSVAEFNQRARHAADSTVVARLGELNAAFLRCEEPTVRRERQAGRF